MGKGKDKAKGAGSQGTSGSHAGGPTLVFTKPNHDGTFTYTKEQPEDSDERDHMMEAPKEPKLTPEQLRAADEEFFKHKMTEMEGRYRASFDNDALMSSFVQQLQYLQQQRAVNYTASFGMGGHNTKPASEFPRPPPLRSLLPVYVRDLARDTTHRGRVLRGVIASPAPVVMLSAVILVQDERGDLARVALYNLLPSGNPHEAAQKLLAKGRRIAIIEPFNKLMTDGGLGVRVDNPNEVLFDEAAGAGDSVSAQEEGNKLFRAQHFDQAASTYTHALNLLIEELHHASTTSSTTGGGSAPATNNKKAKGKAKAAASAGVSANSNSASLLPTLLRNSAACYSGLGEPGRALGCALVAAVLEPSSYKAYYRAALSLNRLYEALGAQHKSGNASSTATGGTGDASTGGTKAGGAAHVSAGSSSGASHQGNTQGAAPSPAGIASGPLSPQQAAEAAAECMHAAIRHGSAAGMARADLIADMSDTVVTALSVVESRAAKARASSGGSSSGSSGINKLTGLPNAGWKDSAQQELTRLSLTALGAGLKVLLLLADPTAGAHRSGSGVVGTSHSGSSSSRGSTEPAGASGASAASATQVETITRMGCGLGGMLQGPHEQEGQKQVVSPVAAAAAKEAGNAQYSQGRYQEALGLYLTGLKASLPSALPTEPGRGASGAGTSKSSASAATNSSKGSVTSTAAGAQSTSAATTVCQRAATLLSNRAAAHLKAGAAQAAAVDAAAAVMLLQCSVGQLPQAVLYQLKRYGQTQKSDPGSSSDEEEDLPPLETVRDLTPLEISAVKAAHRLASALLQLGWLPEARAAVSEGLALESHNRDMCDLARRIIAALGSGTSAGAAAGKSAGSSRGGEQPRTSGATGVQRPGGGNGFASGSAAAATQQRGTSGLSDAAAAASASMGSSSSSSNKKKASKGTSNLATGAQGEKSDAAGKKSEKRGQRPKVPMSERELHALMKSGASHGELAMFNSLFEMMGMQDPQSPAASFLDTRIPPFHKEFSTAGRWPAQVDVEKCQALLLNAYEHARCMPLQDKGIVESGLNKDDTGHVFMRLGSVGDIEAQMQWMCTAPSGDVRPVPGAGMYAQSPMFQSFGNTPARKEVYTPGTTHVAVGFVDLGDLASALLLWGPETGLGSSSSSTSRSSGGANIWDDGVPVRPKGHGPLRWVGFELSPYCVAKTAVIATMLGAGAEVDAVLQVWYSAAWSSSTLSAFRSALTLLLAEPVVGGVRLAPEVVRLLRHWQTSEVPLKTGRKLWMDSLSDTHAWVGSWTRKADRLALCSYLMTGQVLQGADTGSILMFSVPKEYGERGMSENVLHTIHVSDLMNELRAKPNQDIMQAIASCHRTRITRLREAVSGGYATVELHLKEVRPSDRSLQKEIKAMQPYTMSWSNVSDYFQPQDFHDMARACSAKETVHYMHSINWPRVTKGASHLDIKATMGPSESPKILAGLLEASKTGCAKLLWGIPGCSDYVLFPPVDNARNLIDSVLYTTAHKAYVDHWVQAAGQPSIERHTEITQPPMYSVTSRANSAMHITWTYDTSIQFTAGPSV